MNDKKIKILYKAHAEQNAPDMGALWERIEQGLEEKSDSEVSGVTSKHIRKTINFRKASVWTALAAVVALIILPIAFRDVNNSDMEFSSDSGYVLNESPPAVAAEKVTENNNDGGGCFDNSESGAMDTSPEETDAANSAGVVLYENLSFSPAAAPEAVPSGETVGDDFFVEANVLIHTDIIVNAYVDKAYSRGGTVCYELTAENADTHETENITIESATPYMMLENRSYILPLKSDTEGYSLVFENAPQIEVTLDGGMIFHNGWTTLDDESAADVIYPQNGIDDFFYDRMKFSYSADVETIVKKWHELKGED